LRKVEEGRVGYGRAWKEGGYGCIQEDREEDSSMKMERFFEEEWKIGGAGEGSMVGEEDEGGLSERVEEDWSDGDSSKKNGRLERLGEAVW
jgi:hypothetical protein